MHVFGLSSRFALLLPCLLWVSGSAFAQTHNTKGMVLSQQQLAAKNGASGISTARRVEGAVYRDAGQTARDEAQVAPPSASAGLPGPIEVALPLVSADEMARVQPKPGLELIGICRSLPGGADQLTGGAWTQLPDGSQLWRMAIRSPGAAAIRIHFQGFHVGAGRVWVHNSFPDDPQVVGPYSGSGTFSDGEFWTGTIASDIVAIEYAPSAGEARPRELPFKVAGISHIWGGGFQPAGGSEVFPPRQAAACTESQSVEQGLGSCEPPVNFALGDALSCNLDASCLSSEWEDTRNAVGHILFVGDEDGGLYQCSGTLLMNERGDFAPYFLTAAHCVNSEQEARSVEAAWFYETDRCNGQAPPRRNVPITEGARLLATQGEGPDQDEWRQGDATLLLLNENPPAGVAFSGWDGSETVAPGTSVTGIHHPRGDFKRYSTGVTARNEIAWSRGHNPPPAVHTIVDWSQGLTEGGSSGSGLFSEPGVLVGVLSAGPKGPEGGTLCDLNPAWDIYSRFSEFYPRISEFLEDPGDGQNELGGTLSPGIPVAFRVPAAADPVIWNGDSSYQLHVGEDVERITLTLRTSTPGVDIDLHARHGSDIGLVNGQVEADHESTGLTGDEEIVIDAFSDPPLRPGTYYVSLSNWTRNAAAEGTLLATFDERERAHSLIPGVPATFPVGPVGTATLYHGFYSYVLEVPPDVAGVELSLRTTPPNVDVDLHVRFGEDVEVSQQRPVDDYSSVGLTGNEDIHIGPESDPPLRPGTYYIAYSIYTENATAQCTLSAEFTYAGGASPTGVALNSGEPVTFTLPRTDVPTLYSGDSAFWIQVPDGTPRLDVELTTLTSGVDVDLFVRRGTRPQLGKNGGIEADASSRGLGGQEYITLTAADGLQAGTYYIAVLMYSANAAADVQLRADIVGGGGGIGTPLQSGVPAEFNLPAVDRVTFFGDDIFRIEVPEGSARLTVDLETLPLGVDVDLFIRYGDPPYVAGGSVVRHFASQSLTGREQIVISADSYPPLWPGTYYIGFAVFTEAAPATCRVTASLAQGERQDIGRITDPPPGSTLPDSAVTFGWAPGPQVEQYYLKVGTTLGGGEIYADDRGTTLLASVSGIPTGGQPIYVRLYSRIGSDWFYNDYTYAACSGSGCAGDLDIAEMISPAPGSTLPGSSVTFEWDAGSGGFNLYRLMVGSQPGGADIRDWWDLKYSVTVTDIPTDGRTIYVRLGSRAGDVWHFNDYVYTAASGEQEDIGRITAPPPGSTLPGSTVTFSWAPGSQVEQYYLKVGTTQNGGQIYESDQGNALSATVSGIPTSGETVHVRLFSRIGPDWHSNDYTYTAFTSDDAPGEPAEITSPAPGSTLPGAAVTFQWSSGVGVAQYYLKVGTAINSGDLYEGDQGDGRSATVSGLPTDGGDVHVRLFSRIGESWEHRDYSYKAFGSPVIPVSGTWVSQNVGFNVAPGGAHISTTATNLIGGAALIVRPYLPGTTGVLSILAYDAIPIVNGRFEYRRESSHVIEVKGRFVSATMAVGTYYYQEGTATDSGEFSASPQ